MLMAVNTLENFESFFRKSEKTAGFGVVFGLFSAEWIHAAKVKILTDEAWTNQ